MSTYWRFECVDHDPPIASDEFTQHTGDRYYQYGIDLARQRPVSSDFVPLHRGEAFDYFTANARRFLLRHPTCNLEIVSESGDRQNLEDER